MRDPARIDKILQRFGDLWKQYPDMRFHQIVQFVVPVSVPTMDMFYIEDDKALAWIEERLMDLEAGKKS